VSFRTRRSRDAHVDELEAEAGDPLQESLQGALIYEASMKRGRAGAHADFAVVELRPQQAARLADESDLVWSWLHRSAPRSLLSITRAASMGDGMAGVIIFCG
jgi:hypothetical protein